MRIYNTIHIEICHNFAEDTHCHYHCTQFQTQDADPLTMQHQRTTFYEAEESSLKKQNLTGEKAHQTTKKSTQASIAKLKPITKRRLG